MKKVSTNDRYVVSKGRCHPRYNISFFFRETLIFLFLLSNKYTIGRHDWLKAFYFDFLQCAIDPRKIDNLKKGSDTVWANLGAQQFHLPQGKPDAQVLEGQIKLVVKDLQAFLDRYQTLVESGSLQGSQFALEAKSNEEGTSSLLVTDPWGSRFEIVEGDETYRDLRGTQTGGEMTEAYSMTDLTFYTPMNCNLPGIARFYEQVLQAPTQLVPNSDDPDRVLVSVGPKQTLTFQRDPNGRSDVRHDDLRDDQVEAPEGFTSFLSNYGPHISMYIADFGGTYQRADQMGVAYVNPRFKRRAYTMDEAIDDCMFRILDIVDPQNPEDGVILKLEHEVRSVVKRDGSKYKSCPFDEIPDECIKN